MLKFIGVNKDKETCLPDKEYVSVADKKSINMVAKCIVHMHITAELRAYWLSCMTL